MAPYKRGSAGDYHRPVSDADAGSGNRCQIEEVPDPEFSL